MRDQKINILLTIHPDARWSSDIHNLVSIYGSTWRHISITGPLARSLLNAGDDIRVALGRSSTALREVQDPVERTRLSEYVHDALAREEAADRYLVLSPSLVPIDMAITANGPRLGDSSIISHFLVAESSRLDGFLDRLIEPKRFSRSSYLLVCPMAMDRAVPRHMQDILTVASSMESDMPVEIWLQPSLYRARTAFEQRHVSWLHIDTHGDDDGRYIMLGPTREYADMLEASDLPAPIAVPLVVAVGCALTGGPRSIGIELLRRGAASVFGPCVIFRSLGIANSEEGQATWYRTFFQTLVAGSDIGAAVRKARRETPGGLLKYAWTLLGSSVVSFGD